MDTDKDISQLERIVEKMIDSYQRLKEEKEVVEKELHMLQETVESLKGEKATVHKRVMGLIQSIEKVEKNAQSKVEGEGVQAAVQKQTPIFSIGS
jgi:predicted nuclease with TOPRIM domain